MSAGSAPLETDAQNFIALVALLCATVTHSYLGYFLSCKPKGKKEKWLALEYAMVWRNI